MEFGIEKGAMLIMNKGKRETIECFKWLESGNHEGAQQKMKATNIWAFRKRYY